MSRATGCGSRRCRGWIPRRQWRASGTAVSGLKSYGEGLVTLWYQEDYRDDTVVICRVQHLGPDAGPGEG